MTKTGTRSRRPDVLRGLAMLLVILGHTMTGCTRDAQSTLVFRMVWSLQMPLFFLISGYVTRFSRPVEDGKSLLRQLGRRTLQLLWPFAVWTFLIRGLIFGQRTLLQAGWLSRHMDAGYWFLFSLWVISILYLCAAYAAGRICRNPRSRAAASAALFCLLLILPAGLALWQGTDFLGGKLTLYYAAFYLLGALMGAFAPESLPRRSLLAAGTAFSLALWLALILRFDFYGGSDGAAQILLRALSSLLGCGALWGAVTLLEPGTETLPSRALRWIGTHTLEIYLVHYLLLSLIRLPQPPLCAGWTGAGLTAMNFCLTLALSSAVTLAVSRWRISRLVLYGKWERDSSK